jgi:hypothetical protein
LARFAKLKFPELSAVVVALAAPVRLTAEPLPPDAGEIVPESENF